MNSSKLLPSHAFTDKAIDEKKNAFKKKVQKYYFQLTTGCGDVYCTNENCASCQKFKFQGLSPDKAAILALELCKNKASICEPVNSNVYSPQDQHINSLVPEKMVAFGSPVDDQKSKKNFQSSTSSKVSQEKETLLCEKKLREVMKEALERNNWDPFSAYIFNCFSDPYVIMNSFIPSSHDKNQKLIQEKNEEDMDFSDIESADVCSNKDDKVKFKEGSAVDGPSSKPPFLFLSPDSSEVSYKINLDLKSLITFSNLIRNLSEPRNFMQVFQNAIQRLSVSFFSDPTKSLLKENRLPHIYAIIMEMPYLDSVELMEKAVPNFFKTIPSLPLSCQEVLVWYWGERFKLDTKINEKKRDGKKDEKERGGVLRSIVCSILSVMNTQIIMSSFYSSCLHESLEGPVTLLRMLYYANMLAGKMDENWMKKDIQERKSQMRKTGCYYDNLSLTLGFGIVNCVEPLIPLKEFVHELLSIELEVEKDYTLFRKTGSPFSFLSNSFVLTTATKQLALYLDNRVSMMDERRAAFFQNFLDFNSGHISDPYLRIHVSREHLIEDALMKLELINSENPQDLRKQLFVEFEGEQGVDEGGLSKEFFQLVVEKIFNPDYGMFRYDEETHCFWFNEFSFENQSQYFLIGVIIGLAIYNNVILDIRFPMVVYKKLLKCHVTLYDLIETRPTLGKNLKELKATDVTNLDLDFTISLSDVFGNLHTEELLPNGCNISVDNINKQEYVDNYVDYLLNKSVKKQFDSFHEGFQAVMHGSCIFPLFTPSELELLIAGSDENYDFVALQNNTKYEAGFERDFQYIKDFWDIVHNMNLEEKKKLLQFTTGSDRVPIEGLAKLKFVIAKNGPDTDRLPTAHTCFNILLLPEYKNKDKLKEKLIKAIDYCKGFGLR